MRSATDIQTIIPLRHLFTWAINTSATALLSSVRARPSMVIRFLVREILTPFSFDQYSAAKLCCCRLYGRSVALGTFALFKPD